MSQHRDAALYWSVSLLPVQELIAAGRRTRDLFVGSALLSWLMSESLRALEAEGGEVIVPSPRIWRPAVADSFELALLSSHYSLSNRARGVADSSNAADVERVLRGLQERVVEKSWAQVAGLVTQQSTKASRGLGASWPMLEPFLQSVPCPVQLVWAAYAGAGESLKKGLQKAEAAMSSVKRQRPIVPHAGAPVGKCNQCVRREAVGGSDWPSWRDFQTKLAAVSEVQTGYKLEPKDQLCAVCIVKRLVGYLPDQASMESTSEIAANEWLHQVENGGSLQPQLAEWREAARGVREFREDPYPLLYGRTRDLVRRRTEQPDVLTKLDRVDRAAAAIQQSFDAPGQALPKEPSNYLAVLVLDGDGIGEAGFADPTGVAELLADFVAELGDLVRSHRARPVYLGGDEGLILCPLDRCLDLAGALRQRWRESVEEGPSSLPSRPTMSVGICVFDRERPLGGAIAQAHEAVAAAKDLPGKNALAIDIQTASGSCWRVRAPWGGEWARTRAAIKLVQEGSISSGWAHGVEHFLRSLPAKEFGSIREPVRAEIERLTRRSFAAAGKNDSGESTEDAFVRVWQEDLLGDALCREWPVTAVPETLAEFPDVFHLIGFFARQIGSAEGPPVSL